MNLQPQPGLHRLLLRKSLREWILFQVWSGLSPFHRLARLQ
jgi:hypothetical protein